MFTRIVECKAKPGKREELATKIRNEVLAILQRQSGFVDLVTLEDNSDKERFVCLSFWHTREAAEQYHRNCYEGITNMLASSLGSNPEVHTFQVDDSTVHRITASKAA